MRSLTRSWLALCMAMLTTACPDEDLQPPPEKTEALMSRVELAAGSVWQEVDGEKTRLITGAMLAASSSLRVDDGGRALIRLDNGSGVFLREGTVAEIASDAVNVTKGEIWVDVPADDDEMGRFSAKDVTVSASDAGLDIAIKKDAVVVYVARGLAVVNGPGGRCEVGSGEQVVVKGKSALKSEPVAFWEDWTGGMADNGSGVGVGGQGSGRIYGIDRDHPGHPPFGLQITEQKVNIGIKDGIAHTVVDQSFFNPGSNRLEGWYWFTLPEGAFVERFALEVNGVLVDGKMVERKQAAAAYEAAVEKSFDPALLEWIDGRTFRARIYPIPAAGTRRVTLSYYELLPMSDGVYRYTYPMASAGDTTIQEFSLNVDLGEQGPSYTVRTLQDAKVSDDRRITMRRSGFAPKADFLLELTPKEETEMPLRVMRYATGHDEADYVMMRYAPNVDFNAQKSVPGDVVVVLDTSAGGDDADRIVRADAVEAILRALSKGDRFAVVATDLQPRVVFPKEGLATATEENVSLAVEQLAEIPSAGATDLGEMFSTALNLLHDGKQPAVVYVGDGQATVGETSSHALASRLKRAMGDSRARLFTIAVGTNADTGLLSRLARIGGGRSFDIHRSEQAVQEALRFVSMLKTPTITDLTIDAGKGLDQVFTTGAGKLSKGDEMILVARTHHQLPPKISIRGRLGDEDIEGTFEPKVEKGPEFGYLPLIWARQYLSRLMGDGIVENRGRIISLGLNYTMMTPYTSFLVLENNAAYDAQGIPRRNRYRFSLRQKEGSAVASARNVAAIPLGLFGCSSQEAPMEQMSKAEEVSDMIKPPPSPEQQPAPSSSVGAGSGKLADGLMNGPKMDRKSSSHYGRRAKKQGKSSYDDEVSLAASIGDAEEKQALPLIEKETSKSQKRHRPEPAPKGRSSRAKPTGFKPAAPPTPSRDIFKKGICSDASKRPLSERHILWHQRFYRITDPAMYKNMFFDAGSRCELPRWKDRKVMLNLIEQRLQTPNDVQVLLAGFERYPRIERYVRNRILRRTLDPALMLGRFYPASADWSAIATGLEAVEDLETRLDSLRSLLKNNPEDPTGRALLVSVLARMGRNDEAIREAVRLRRDGLATMKVMEKLCELQAAAGQIEAAKRACSELVEFNAKNGVARRRLGDIFLRHGWHEAAYRQYAGLVEMTPNDPIALLRKAAAAAGMGKIDEALRIERKVASGDGEPGPNDPRRFARLHSAAKLAKMLQTMADEKSGSKARAVERSLKQTQVFTSPSTIAFLVWEDLEAPLNLVPMVEDNPYAVSEQVNAEETGLIMLDLGAMPTEALQLLVQLSLDAETFVRVVPYTLLTVTFDGKHFSVESKNGSWTTPA